MSLPPTDQGTANRGSLSTAPRFAVGELIFALSLAALGGAVLAATPSIPIPLSEQGTLGPRALPYAVGAFLAVVGVLLVIQVLRGRLGDPEDGEDVDAGAATAWRTVALLVVCVTAHVFLIIPLGWPIAATVLFAGSAVVLGARPIWRAVLIAVVMALVIQIAFGNLLGLSLPPGPLLEGLSIFRG